ncbi:Mce protein [Mycolicibacterium sp. HK-90]|uniref:Mce protein n=1 Tax=Mycolicibacterium sp. HK-90 TaxID=3056937 RepID=UPI002657C2B0|nr:Mce protein [Mycolicibacterium sp. HK-90]WKG02926.1 Mce protein [Mycolicibacterium sp. HK-90]
MTATIDDDTTSPAGEAEPESGRLGRLSVAAGAAVLIATAGASALLGSRVWQHRQADTAANQAQATASAYAETLTTIDSGKVDENFTRILDGATGEFKDMYTQSSVQLRQLLIDNRATARGTVVDSAIKSRSTDEVEVLLFVDQSVSNSASPEPRLDRSRIRMTMKNIDGRWLASKVELP